MSLDDIELHLMEIMHELEKIHNRLDRIDQSCNRLDKHIGFIEHTYDGLKKPIDAIKFYFSKNKLISN